MNENAFNALKLLKKESNGILSTHSLEVEGYPFGSLAPYALDNNSNPIILISGLAQHTKNINVNNKVSLTISETTSETQKQATGRLTLLADATLVEENSDDYENVSEVYLRYFPSAAHYFEAHDFSFYRLNFVRGRFIQGFGKIYWVEKEDWNFENVFSKEDELRIIDHMNGDHQDALRNYCRHYKGIQLENEGSVKMIGLYQWGMDLSVGKQKVHFIFDEKISNANEARELLVKMAKESR